MSDILVFLIIFLPICWWVWWMNKDQPKPKLDFGPERPKSLRSFDGLLYILWNWKSYLAKTVWIGLIPFVWYTDGFGAMISWIAFGGVLILLGLFWEQFKK
jgi:hypothetical protein